ncbi:ribosomal protein L25, Ctc-form [Synechococcus sp. PCC 7335]|uniref:50S ribosomal protein L25/general stress protein Ctc n=1 Tax=Synechococcus sp. (strain ATCC 29403 / PCC 7335) TaxID=91464 RepID=UPI00017ECEE1|nr:50S ribosomal protein L25/general stress protein Ctc [Synechococcus sp. PCC 7335]EDX86950.1 ribosomal protein L25, Ctc-form [Synechococcus sp. PCC 7335]
MDLSIECAQRAPEDKPKRLRREGTLPAVLYGHDGANSLPLKLSNYDAEALLRKASVNKSVITVNVPDVPWSGKVILREVQKHPWKNKLHHLSFFSIASQSEIEVSMPINFVGDAVGVTDEGGTLDTVMTEIQLKCPPDAIPQSLDVDVSELKIGDALHVGEIKLPKGTSVTVEPSLLVVSVLAPRTAAAVEAASGEVPEATPTETLNVEEDINTAN